MAGLRRWVVIGTTGSGKTTFARQLAGLLGVPHVELDALNWQPGWQEADRGAFREAVDISSAGPAWVIEGGYSRVRDLVWGRAQGMVWLDYPYPIILSRLFWRTLRRGLRREELWNGNHEQLWMNFATRESLFLWQLQTHWRRRPEYERWLAEDFAHLELHRFRWPWSAERWLAGLREPHSPITS